MHKPSPGIAVEGLPLIGFFSLATVSLAILQWDLIAVTFLVITYFLLHFFRDPQRSIPSQPEVAVSPADGKIIHLGQAPDPVNNQICSKISIFMSVFDVHVNRSPVAAKVKKISYHQGRFFQANKNKASKVNEQNILQLIDDQDQIWTVVQVAGLVARRIVCRVEEGDIVRRGHRIGLIKFGSRVDLYLPHGYDFSVSLGEKVFSGQTIIAKSTAESVNSA